MDHQKEKKTLACPKWLMPEAKAEWRRLAKKIKIADEDVMILAGYCQSYARWREAEEYITEHGFETDNTSRILPYVSVAQTYLKLMGGFAKQLGIASETGEIMNEADE